MGLRCFRLPLDQNSRFMFIWDCFHSAAIHASYILVWFQAAFDSSISWQLSAVYVLDVFYLLYLLSQFITSYKEKGKVVKDHKKIGLKVMKTIILDIFSLLPLEVISLISDQPAAYFRLNRSLRFFRVYKFFGK